MRPLLIGIALISVYSITMLVSQTHAQTTDFSDRLVRSVQISGASVANRQFIENQIRVQPGQPYNRTAVQRDVTNITRLGRFSEVRAQIEQNPDGSLQLTYVVTEFPLLVDVQVVGNKELSDEALLAVIQLRAGDPRDDYLIKRAANNIVRIYKSEGYFLAEATIDEKTLSEQNVLVFQVREGPYIEVEKIEFKGNTVFDDGLLEAEIETRTKFLIFGSAPLNDEALTRDVDAIRQFHRERGYLEARVGRDIQLNADQTRATIVFLVDEGRLFTVNNIRVEGNQLHSADQIREALSLKRGTAYRDDLVRESTAAVSDLYGKIGYIGTQVVITSTPLENEALLDVVVNINESKQNIVGNVLIRGNTKTQDKVIRRQLRGLEPGRPFDASGIELTQNRLRASRLFSEADIVLQGSRDDVVRDAVVEVKEQRTGSVSFGAAVGSDSGLVGAINLSQANFDISDTPESLEQFTSGQAFLGGGQFFQIALEPGNDVSRYQVTWRDPYIFDSLFSFEVDAFYRQRDFDEYDEGRAGGSFGIGKTFGDVWSASVFTRYELIDISSIVADAPVDVFDVEGGSTLDSVGIRIVRDTTDNRIFPTRGSRLDMTLMRYGVLGGDYEFTKGSAELNMFWTVHEDFFGRKSVLKLRTEIGYIFESNEAPIFERFYAGGHRSFRGFAFRGAGPRGIRNDTMTLGDEAVGADFLFLLGLEYNFPVFEETLRWVVFVDSGTVQDDIGLDDYRVSIGTGVRLQLPILGQAPLAIDFAIPILKESGDETQLISFSLALPF